MVIVASPKQAVADEGAIFTGPHKVIVGSELSIAKNNEAITNEDEIVTAWRKLVARKNRIDAEKDRVIAGKKTFVATIRNKVTRTLVVQNGGAMSLFRHVTKIIPATSHIVVTRDHGHTPYPSTWLKGTHTRWN